MHDSCAESHLTSASSVLFSTPIALKWFVRTRSAGGELRRESRLEAPCVVQSPDHKSERDAWSFSCCNFSLLSVFCVCQHRDRRRRRRFLCSFYIILFPYFFPFFSPSLVVVDACFLCATVRLSLICTSHDCFLFVFCSVFHEKKGGNNKLLLR